MLNEEQKYLESELLKAIEMLEINISNIKNRIDKNRSIASIPTLTENALAFDRVLYQLRLIEKIKSNGS